MSDAAPEGTLAREYLPDISSLSNDHQATFRIGQMMRLTVGLDQSIRGSYALLTAFHPELPKPKKFFAQLIAQVPKAISLNTKLGWLLDDASAALNAIGEIYERRNRFAHDLFLFNGIDRWTQVLLESPYDSTVDIGLSDMREAVLDMVQAQWRADALHNVIYGALGQREPEVPDQLLVDDSWLAILRGQFELSPAGGVHITALL